jgi:hypothetical protein
VNYLCDKRDYPNRQLFKRVRLLEHVERRVQNGVVVLLDATLVYRGEACQFRSERLFGGATKGSNRKNRLAGHSTEVNYAMGSRSAAHHD